MIRLLALLACVLTVGITAASAFIRHSQAGLGCEGWPACYEAAAARRDVPAPAHGAGAVAIARGLHRVAAMGVGLLAIGIAFVGWSRLGSRDRAAAAFALAVTVGLAWLGRYTPHDLPLVTLANVVGGFALAGAFAWIAAGAGRGVGWSPPGAAAPRWPGITFALALAAIVLQTWLGVMIGARSAVAACGALDCVAGAAVEVAAFDPGVARAVLEAPAARGLQLAHRIAAGSAGLLLGLFALGAMRPAREGGGAGSAAGPAAAVLALLALLAASGFTTVATDAPIASATAHNALAALLVAATCATARRSAGARHPGTGLHGEAVPVGPTRTGPH